MDAELKVSSKDLNPKSRIEIKIAISNVLRFRLWLGLKIVLFGALIMGLGCKVSSGIECDVYIDRRPSGDAS